ncbi:MAG: hypothetical protein WBG37_15355 [Desulfobacterales bacterium]
MKAKWIPAVLCVLCSLFLLSTSAIALNVTYLDPDYQVSGSFALPFDTIALVFDSVDNLYTVRRADFSSAPGNTIEIIKLDALTNYLTSSVYATYSGYGISGLEFDSAGNLFVSEIMRKPKISGARSLSTILSKRIDTIRAR